MATITSSREYSSRYFLVAEPHVVPSSSKIRSSSAPSADDGLELVAQLHRRRVDRALEGDAALAVLGPDPQGAAAPAERFVLVVEEGVLLQPPPEEAAARPPASTAARAWSTDSNLSLISRSSVVVMAISGGL
jgi:hypothetical protein